MSKSIITCKRELYRDEMGFLPCDALGPYVYCAYIKGHLAGYSQMSYERAVSMAREKLFYYQTPRELYELAYNWCRAMHQYGAFGPADDGIAIMKRIPVHIRRAAARSFNARRYQRFDWVAGSWRPGWLPF